MEPVRRREPAENPRPGVETTENVTVRDRRVAYPVSRPIPKGKTLGKVVITIVSKDQGWLSYPADHGTYHNG